VTPPRLASLFAALAAAASPTLAGCGGSGCLLNAVPGLEVTVLDGAGGPVLCGATVTATDGAYSELLAASPAGGPCYHYGATERPGTYSIEATFEGRTGAVSNVRVAQGECHVTKNEVSIVLPAAAASGSRRP
jgi:hypothetical protein